MPTLALEWLELVGSRPSVSVSYACTQVPNAIFAYWPSWASKFRKADLPLLEAKNLHP